MEYKVLKMAQMVGKNIFNLLKRGDWWKVSGNIFDTLPQTNSSGEIPPFLDVFRIGKGGFPAQYFKTGQRCFGSFTDEEEDDDDDDDDDDDAVVFFLLQGVPFTSSKNGVITPISDLING